MLTCFSKFLSYNRNKNCAGRNGNSYSKSILKVIPAVKMFSRTIKDFRNCFFIYFLSYVEVNSSSFTLLSIMLVYGEISSDFVFCFEEKKLVITTYY